MSEILIQDPGSNEAQSPLIAGITEALNKISKILNLQTGTLKDEPLRNVPISESDKNRIYQAQDGKRLWLSSPAPTFKKNGAPITQEQAQFSIDYVGGSISFNELGRLGDSDNVTVSCTYIIATSKTITDLTNSLSATSNVANRYKGSYASLSALQSAHATASVGDFAIVQSPGAVFIWTGSAWKNTQSIEDLSVYYKKTEVDNLLNKKEPTISAHGSSTSSDNFFYGGRKTWVDLYSKIRSATLTGLSTATNSAISATDTVLSAFGKLQAQVSGATAKAFLTGTGAPSTSTKGVIGQRYVNTSNGDWYTCTAAGQTYTWEQGQEKITSLKNPYALTISLNGKSQGAYDGSAAKSINVTPSAIGAATASHTQAASTITGLTANRALVSDISGHPAVSAVTNVELGYLDGVKSNIQNQIDSKVASSELITKIKDYLHPIGSIFEWVATSGSPDLFTPEQVASYFGFGTWEAYGKGRVTVGIDSEDPEFVLAGKTGGEKTHSLTGEENGAHTHEYAVDTNTTYGGQPGYDFFKVADSGKSQTKSSGSGKPHNNLQPYIVVYRYRRIA